MDPLKLKDRTGPEAKIQGDIVNRLRTMEWFVKETHGNMFQSGLPDLFAAHIKYGSRWIEVKNPLSFSFTPAQTIDFPKMSAAGVGIWILFSHSDHEMMKLFKPANWYSVYYNKVHGLQIPDWKGPDGIGLQSR